MLRYDLDSLGSQEDSVLKMAEEKSHDDDDMTPEERVAWLRDHVSLNGLLLLLI
jgi:hypothetical protein